jgi:Uma2 family endonuclease
MPAIAEKYVTPEELLALDDGKHYELVDGQLVEKNMSSFAVHVAFLLAWHLENYVRQGRDGMVFTENYYACPQWQSADKATVRRPDVSYVAAGRMTEEQYLKGHAKIAPDLAVEVLSPNDRVCELDVKVDAYFEAGVQEVWLVRPHVRRVSTYRPGLPREFKMGDVLTSPELLPGFELRVSELFTGTFR